MTAELLDTAAAARYLGVSCPTLERFRLKGDGPQFVKITPGKRGPVRYRRVDLDTWVISKLVNSTSDKAA